MTKIIGKSVVLGFSFLALCTPTAATEVFFDIFYIGRSAANQTLAKTDWNSTFSTLPVAGFPEFNYLRYNYFSNFFFDSMPNTANNAAGLNTINYGWKTTGTFTPGTELGMPINSNLGVPGVSTNGTAIGSHTAIADTPVFGPVGNLGPINEAAELHGGLRSAFSFQVAGLGVRTDIARNSQVGVGLTDQTFSSDGSAASAGNDNLRLGLNRLADGRLFVQLTQLLYTGFTLIDTVLISETDVSEWDGVAAYIDLNIERYFGSNNIYANFVFSDVNFNVVGEGAFNLGGDSRATIFNGEDFTRGLFYASSPVPTPASLALLCAGLIAMARRKHSKFL